MKILWKLSSLTIIWNHSCDYECVHLYRIVFTLPVAPECFKSSANYNILINISYFIAHISDGCATCRLSSPSWTCSTWKSFAQRHTRLFRKFVVEHMKMKYFQRYHDDFMFEWFHCRRSYSRRSHVSKHEWSSAACSKRAPHICTRRVVF